MCYAIGDEPPVDVSACFQDRVAVVTGAGSGIGRALALALGRAGARVVATDLDGARARETIAELDPRRTLACALDVTDAGCVEDLVEHVEEEIGPIGLLFNNAGVGLGGEVRDMTLADWHRTIDVNLWGVIHGVQAVYPRMAARGSGHVVNVASGAGLAPRPGMTAYAATKHAVVGLSTSLRAEAAGLGVRVSAVCPGYIATNIQTSTRFVGVDGAGLMARVPIRPIPAAACAERILAGVARDRAIIVIGAHVWADWLLYRLSPALAIWASRWRARTFRAHRTEPAPSS